jgi:hypothetical protein
MPGVGGACYTFLHSLPSLSLLSLSSCITCLPVYMEGLAWSTCLLAVHVFLQGYDFYSLGTVGIVYYCSLPSLLPSYNIVPLFCIPYDFSSLTCLGIWRTFSSGLHAVGFGSGGLFCLLCLSGGRTVLYTCVSMLFRWVYCCCFLLYAAWAVPAYILSLNMLEFVCPGLELIPATAACLLLLPFCTCLGCLHT